MALHIVSQVQVRNKSIQIFLEMLFRSKCPMDVHNCEELIGTSEIFLF